MGIVVRFFRPRKLRPNNPLRILFSQLIFINAPGFKRCPNFVLQATCQFVRATDDGWCIPGFSSRIGMILAFDFCLDKSVLHFLTLFFGFPIPAMVIAPKCHRASFPTVISTDMLPMLNRPIHASPGAF